MNKFHFSPLIFLSLIYISYSININEIVHRNLEECHPNCQECSGPATDSHHMNCLSCKEGFYHYKTNNCLNCSNYINYELTECIDKIPDGYYLDNEELGTLGKCHEFCKTCDGPPMPYGMQCIECKYKEEGFKPTYETDCPDGIDDEEEIPFVPGGQCPRSQPILIRKDFCSMVYCSEKDYEEGMCEVNNSIIETQWINKVERFGDGEIDNVCLDYGDNGELFLFGQEKDENDQRWLHMYGIDKNQIPILYDNDKDEYTYFKKIPIPFDIVIENIRVVKNFETDNLFLITTQINQEMYVIDYFNDKTNIHKFNQVSLSWKMSDIILIKKLSNVYLTNFVTCKSENNCHGFLREFSFTRSNDIKLIKQYTSETRINTERNFICIESYTNYVQCLSTKFDENKYILDLYDVNTLRPRYQFTIEKNMNDSTNVIESMNKLNNDSFIIVYSLKNNRIKVLIKSIKYNYNMFSLDV